MLDRATSGAPRNARDDFDLADDILIELGKIRGRIPQLLVPKMRPRSERGIATGSQIALESELH